MTVEAGHEYQRGPNPNHLENEPVLHQQCPFTTELQDSRPMARILLVLFSLSLGMCLWVVKDNIDTGRSQAMPASLALLGHALALTMIQLGRTQAWIV